MPILDHFGIIAPFYDRLIPLWHVQQLVSLADLPVSGPLLDAGGGTGRVAQALQGLASEIIVGDLSMGMLRQAKDRKGLASICSHTEFLPYPDESFARVIMVDALHHVHSQTATANEIWRVLQKGGRIVIEEPDVRTLVVILVAIAEKLVMMRSHFLAPQRIAALFPYANARIQIERQGYNAWVIIDKE